MRERSFFVYGFAKNEMGNISEGDEQDFKHLAVILLNVTDAQIAKLVELGEYTEIACHGQNEEL